MDTIKQPVQPKVGYKVLEPTKATQATKPTTTGVKPNPPKKSREGCNNPFYGKKHSEDTKKKQSETQKARYEAIRQQLGTEGGSINENITAIIRKEVERYLNTECKQREM